MAWTFFINKGAREKKTSNKNTNQSSQKTPPKENVPTTPLVINMSDCTLTDAQLNLLKKGLKFTPTPRNNASELESDVRSFCRNLRLKEHFYKEEDESTEETQEYLVRNKSNWVPRNKQNIQLDNCIDTLMQMTKELPNTPSKPTRNNLTKAEEKALGELMNNKDIIIKKADKGGSVCVMNKQYYADKIAEMLSDNTTYEKTDETKFQNTHLKIHKLIQEHGATLHDLEKDYLTNFESRDSNLYGLPKIHKSHAIKVAIQEQNSDCINIKNPQDLKFRPIVAGPICPTSRLSNLIDILLKDIPPSTKSFVRDDIEFLSKLNRDLLTEQEYMLVTYDVESLYTNIDHDLGIEAIGYWIDKHRDKVNYRFSKDFICKAIQIILQNNTFQFNDEFYLQKNGTAMGTKMAPTYAILVLAYLEEKLYEKIETQYSKELRTFIEDNFLRYIDDCFIVWPKSKWDIDIFSKELNNLHPKFKFTIDQSCTVIPFLDINVHLKGNKILTDIYYKPTDSHQYLRFDSCHPRHIKVSIPYCEARRLCTIIDDEDTKKRRLEEMKEFFIARKYPTKLINDSIKKACSIPQNILRTTKTKNTTDIIPFVSTHNPKNPNIIPQIRAQIDILKKDSKMKKVLEKSKFIASKRQPSSLGKMLVRAKFSNKTEEGGSFKCNHKRCSNCKYINETKSINITSTGKSFNIKHKMTCKSKDVLYIITCNGCNEQYVGLTNDKLANRFSVHRQQIKHPVYRQLGVSEHIDNCSNLDIKFCVTPFYKLPSSDRAIGLTKEAMFIKQFQPSLNNLSLSH